MHFSSSMTNVGYSMPRLDPGPRQVGQLSPCPWPKATEAATRPIPRVTSRIPCIAPHPFRYMGCWLSLPTRLRVYILELSAIFSGVPEYFG